MKIGRLTDVGMARFATWLDSLRIDPTIQPPAELLTDLIACEPLGASVELEAKRLSSRFDAAEYIHGCITAEQLPEVEGDSGLWAWLSLFFIDTVCPPDAKGGRKPGALARHIPEPSNFQRYYRHLLAGPYRIYRAHRDDPRRALALLCQPVDSPGDVVEQLASRQELVTNRGIMGLATKLYVAPDSLKVKTGAGGKGGGSARRLSDVIEQFDLTWDLYAATPNELAAVMPLEFAKYLNH
ncbi:MAG: hypothetical protein JNM31_07755 [Flavobacteriales bacterium]|nr:hypothetical protein [Flavobacteriales bacterium]